MRMRWFGIAIVISLTAGCAGKQVVNSTPVPGDVQEGYASYYHDSLHGNLTANGEVYDRNALTAAHRTLPFGTEVRVTNLANGKSILLRINDRGPFVDGRIIDVSRRAAELLEFIDDGVVEVRLEVVAMPTG